MRIKKLCITIILICCGLLCFSACKIESVVQSISVKGYSAETVVEVPFGGFPYGKYTVLANYDNGETEEIALTEDMVVETDKLKFFQVGENQITIAYKGVTTSMTIKISRDVFPENVQLNCKAEPYPYTGEPVVIEVVGDIPGGTKILYPQGNSFKNAGSYDMTAVLQCEGYVTKELSAHIEIAKATYDLSQAILYKTRFTYDRDPHSITVKGREIKDENNDTIGYEVASLPKGVSVSYTITDRNGHVVDKAINVGEYTVTATFRGSDSNYTFEEGKDVGSKSVSVTMSITPVEYETSKIDFIGKTVTYTGEAYSLSVDEATLPKNVEVSYKTTKVQDGNGKEMEEDVKAEKGVTEPGVYKVLAIFSVIDEYSANYTIDVAEKEATLTIVRFVYETSKIEFNNRVVAYTGTAYSLNIDEEDIPENIEVSYKIVKMVNGEEGEVISDKNVKEIGAYKVIASFKVISIAEPYYTIDMTEKEAYLTIQPASYDNEMWDLLEVRKTVYFDKTEYTFIEDETCEIYLTCGLPEWITPKLTLFNEAGEEIWTSENPTEEEYLSEEEESTEEDFPTKKCKYVFTSSVAGKYTCVLTFVHETEKYLPITLKLEVSVTIIASNA